MLEYPALRLGPWSAGPIFERAIFDAASGTRLGSARLTLGERRWWLWRDPDLLRVYETEDEAILLTAERYGIWKPAWIVREADDRVVGTIHGRTARDGLGQWLAVREVQGGVRRWRGASEAVLAEARDEGQTMVSFPSPGSPFLRMLLLADLMATA